MNNRSIAYIILAATVLNGIVHADADSKKITTVVEKQERVGYIDAFQVMRESDEGKVATQALEQQRTELSNAVQKAYQEYMQAENEYKAQASMLNDATRLSKEEKLMEMKRKLERDAKESEEKLQVAMQRTTEQLAKKVREAAALLAQDIKLDSVQDVMSGQVLYTSPKVTYTSQAVTKMNQAYKVELAQNKDAKKEAVAASATSKKNTAVRS